MWLRLFLIGLLCNVAFSQSDGLCSIISSESSSDSSFSSSSDGEGQRSDCTRDAFCDVETSTCVCKQGFTGDGVTCMPVNKCKLPGHVRNGNWSRLGEARESNHFYPGDRVKYSCKPGYTIKRNNGTKIRTCLVDGSWDLKKPPACVVAKCDAPDGNITNGNSTAIPGNKYPRGGIVEYSCIPGYRIKGSPWLSCVSFDSLSGRWSDSPPTCEEIQCHDVGYPENSNRIGRPPFFVGDEVRFRCASGYTLIGSELRTCQENGKWSGYLTVCDSGVGDCRDPGIPINGRKEGRSYNLGDTVSFRCNTGFSIIGSATRTCLDTGEWSGRQATCRGAGDYDDPESVAASFGKKLDRFVEDTASENTGHFAGRVLDLNYGGRLEIYIAIDGSASVAEKNFKKAVEFAKALVKKTGVSGRPKGPRYGALSYTNKVLDMFHVTEYTDQESVIEELDRFEYTPLGGTGTANALKKIYENMIPTAIGKFRYEDEFAKEPPKRVVILLTDGASNTGGDPIKAADLLKDKYDVEIYVIGIQVAERNDQLIGMASTELPDQHIFILEHYTALEQLATLIVDDTIDYSVCGIKGSSGKSSYGRISGGSNADEGAWPWQAAIWPSITIDGEHLPDSIHPFCGGSVISSTWILTAAHCFYDKFGKEKNESWHKDIIVGLGYTNTNQEENKPYTRLVAVKRVITHEDYLKYDYDIALLELYEPIQFSNYITPVCLPQKTRVSELPYKAGDKMAITGWGNTAQQGIGAEKKPNQTNHLQELYLEVIERTDCAEYLKNKISLTENMFCVGGSSSSSCKGDSGGPVVKNIPANNERGDRWVQFGIVSFGYGCGVAGQHDIMTNVAELMDWIEIKSGVSGGITLSENGEVQQTINNQVNYDDPEHVADSLEKRLEELYSNFGHRLEIYIAIGRSPNITETDFNQSVAFAKALVKKTDVSGRQGPRYGALTYTNEIVDRFHVIQQTDQESVIEELDRFRYPSLGGTGTEIALNEISNDMIPTAIRRFQNATEPSKRVLILLTDGAYYTGGDPITAANLLKENYDVEIYVIGTRVAEQNDKLNEIASTNLSDQHIFRLKNYNALERVTISLLGSRPTAGTGNYSLCGIKGDTFEIISRGRISGGTNAAEGAWPWQAAIWKSVMEDGTLSRDSLHPFCGGSLISSKWILTAAHCFHESNYFTNKKKDEWHRHIIVGLGYTNTNPEQNKTYTRQVAVKRIVTHQQYLNLDYDIALLELDKPVEFSKYIRPVCLPNKTVSEPKFGETMAITGWGNTKQRNINGHRTYSQTTQLQQVYLKTIGRRKCKQDLKNTQNTHGIEPRPLTENMFCVGGSNPSSCKGDSGGPVVKKIPASNGQYEHWIQFGIVSFGHGCGVPGQHDVMTRVTQFTDWIERYTSLEL